MDNSSVPQNLQKTERILEVGGIWSSGIHRLCLRWLHNVIYELERETTILVETLGQESTHVVGSGNTVQKSEFNSKMYWVDAVRLCIAGAFLEPLQNCLPISDSPNNRCFPLNSQTISDELKVVFVLSSMREFVFNGKENEFNHSKYEVKSNSRRQKVNKKNRILRAF